MSQAATKYVGRGFYVWRTQRFSRAAPATWMILISHISSMLPLSEARFPTDECIRRS